ncbi:MAG: hypothetical protein KAS32_23110 [Candidatus Peribacteraceae bacterium]|nr:hypothetical protein [Candidatus Peribacteraceae bacterium]
MTVSSYATDLTTLDDCNTDTGYVEPTASGWSQLNAESFAETDLFIQNANSISATCKTGVGATLFNNTTGITILNDGAFLVWMYWAAPNSLDTETNGGFRTIIGSGTADFDYVIQGGKDTYVYGGWLNLAMGKPSEISTTAVGSPSGTYQYFGWAYNAVTVPSKGNPYVVDCMRYGRCEIRAIDGDITPNGPATFAAMAAKNDANDATAGYNRWGLFQEVSGGYLWKGLMSLGTTTAVYFVDSNVSISIDNTKNVTSAFNAIEINHASSTVNWTGVSITALGTVSKGSFIVVDNATVNLNSCGFTDMGAFTFNDGTNPNDIIDTIFRRCGLITTGGATFTGCTFDELTGAIGITASSPANAALVSDSTLISDGTGNGLEITGTAANITLSNIDFSGYSTTVDANKAIYVNIASGSMTINISGGSGVTASSHVRTAGCTVTVSADTTVTFTNMKDNTEGRVYENISVEDTDISFTSTNTISSAGSSFGGFSVDDIISVSGSLLNDGGYTVVTASASTLTVSPSTITTESTGETVKIKKTNQVEIAGIEIATAGTTDNRTYAWSAASGTVVDYVLHNWNAVAPFYQTVRVNGYPVPGTNTSVGIQQQIDRNAE